MNKKQIREIVNRLDDRTVKQILSKGKIECYDTDEPETLKDALLIKILDGSIHVTDLTNQASSIECQPVQPRPPETCPS